MAPRHPHHVPEGRDDNAGFPAQRDSPIKVGGGISLSRPIRIGGGSGIGNSGLVILGGIHGNAGYRPGNQQWAVDGAEP